MVTNNFGTVTYSNFEEAGMVTVGAVLKGWKNDVQRSKLSYCSVFYDWSIKKTGYRYY